MKSALTALAYTGLTLGSLTFAMTVAAQDDAADPGTAAEAMVDDIDREGERCISVSRLRSTHAVDDRTMLFYMRGGDTYLNVLSHNCPGLKRQNRISYKLIAGERVKRGAASCAYLPRTCRNAALARSASWGSAWLVKSLRT